LGARTRTAVRLAAYLALAAGVGALTGLLWEAVVDLTTYRVDDGGGAATGERGLTAVIAGDAWFTVLGLVAGLALGWVGWRRLRPLGWSLTLIALGAATGAGLLCWLIGYELGPGPLAPRLAVAQPGDAVPIELTLRSRAALLAWPFGAVIPVLLGSSLGREEEEEDAASA
jgi:hypothetical protein